MIRRWGVVSLTVTSLTVTLLLSRAARAETFLAQASWPPALKAPQLVEQPVAGPRITLRADSPTARLQQFTPLMWKDICLSPCGVTVDPAGTYRIGGGEAMTSDPFTLPRPSGDVFIDARVRSKVTHWVGLGMMIGGVAVAGYGVLWWQFFEAFSSNDSSQAAQDARSFGRNVGIVFISIGAVLELVGLPLFFGGTSVQVR